MFCFLSYGRKSSPYTNICFLSPREQTAVLLFRLLGMVTVSVCRAPQYFCFGVFYRKSLLLYMNTVNLQKKGRKSKLLRVFPPLCWDMFITDSSNMNQLEKLVKNEPANANSWRFLGPSHLVRMCLH